MPSEAICKLEYFVAIVVFVHRAKPAIQDSIDSVLMAEQFKEISQISPGIYIARPKLKLYELDSPGA